MSKTHSESLARYYRVLAFREEGLSLQDIARQEGISYERVRQILASGKPPNPPGRPPYNDGESPAPNERKFEMNTVTLEPDISILPPIGQPVGTEETGLMKVHSIVVPNRMAFATFTPAAMKKLFFVSSFSEADPSSMAPRQHGYQRDPMAIRLAGIARYFLTEMNESLITPIIVSVRLTDEDDIAEFIDLVNHGEAQAIKDRWHKGVVSVVDGQHRYLGLVKAHEDHPEFDPTVPVMLYFNLSYQGEAELFDIINSTQRKLPKALIEVTKGDITEAGSHSHEQVIRTIAFALARDKRSVWYDQVNMTGAREPGRPVTYEGLRRSTANMFPAELLGRLQARDLTPEDVAMKFWTTVAEACPEAWNDRPKEEYDPDTSGIVEVDVSYRIKDLVGVAAVSKLGKDIITSALEHSQFSEKMSDLVSQLSEVDWEKREGNPWMASQAGFAGQRELYTMLHDLVYLGKKPGEDSVDPA